MRTMLASLSTLEVKHRELDESVRRLERRAYLTPSEQQRVSDLKREKLTVKDAIATIRRSSEPPRPDRG